jgi:hypothetical protein
MQVPVRSVPPRGALRMRRCGSKAVQPLNGNALRLAHSLCLDQWLCLFLAARLQALKLSLLFRNALVQVLAFEFGELRSEQPGIALNIPPLAQNLAVRKSVITVTSSRWSIIVLRDGVASSPPF